MEEREYGQRFLPKQSIADIRAAFEAGKKVKIAGRLMTIRQMGKSIFADVKDQDGRIQIYVKGDAVGEEPFNHFKTLKMGDIVGIEGELFTSKMGEMTVKVESYQRLSSIVRPMPEKWHGLKDVETRYRQRYVDLIVNDDVRQVFKTRSLIMREIRKFLDAQGFMEVETPMMQPLAGGARARPFMTHHNTLEMDLYMRIAPELYLKRLLVGGFEKVYEINRNFRNEGISVRHNPEFTMMELYQSYADYHDMMEITESLVHHLVMMIHGKDEIPFGDKVLSFKRPWKRVSFYGAIQEATGIDLRKTSPKEAAEKLNMKLDPKLEDVDVLDEIFSETVEKDLINPTFIIDYPTEMSPLAKGQKEDPSLVYRFELFISKMEIANAFSELNDPFVQRERLESQRDVIGENKEIDEDFLTALEYAMPPAGGLGIGIDRLVMLLTNQESIREVILFPLLRHEKKQAAAEASSATEEQTEI